MEKPLKYTWDVYTGKFEKILVLMLTTTLPLLMVHSFVTNYIYAITPSDLTVYSVADIYYGLITLLLYLYAQFPISVSFITNIQGVENNLRNSVYHFWPMVLQFSYLHVSFLWSPPWFYVSCITRINFPCVSISNSVYKYFR